jgi:hypothetical protein
MVDGGRHRGPTMNANAFRRIAQSMPRAIEAAHMGNPDFWVGKRIFATLGYPDKGWAAVKLTPQQQRVLVAGKAAAFSPVPGGWVAAAAPGSSSLRQIGLRFEKHSVTHHSPAALANTRRAIMMENGASAMAAPTRSSQAWERNTPKERRVLFAEEPTRIIAMDRNRMLLIGGAVALVLFLAYMLGGAVP